MAKINETNMRIINNGKGITLMEAVNTVTEGKSFQEYKDKHGIEDVSVGLGYSDKEKKWYGWSHRAVHGFGIGDYFTECRPDKTTKERKIRTMEDARNAAEKFADSVS